MSEELFNKKQSFMERVNEWRNKYSDCLLSDEEADTIFARDKEVCSKKILSDFSCEE